MNTQAIHDHGENDPLEFTLGSWAPVAAVVKAGAGKSRRGVN